MIDGRAEDDRFNRLVLTAGLAWREVALLRAYCRYLRQTGTRFSLSYIEDALSVHTEIARRLVELFVARLDPWAAMTGPSARARRLRRATKRPWTTPMQSIASPTRSGPSSTRSPRSTRTASCARCCTSCSRRCARTGSRTATPRATRRRASRLKLDPTAIPDLPLPRPMFEIFVYSPRVEGVHLRAGKVARGGIRWSDRREDFRTEVLGPHEGAAREERGDRARGREGRLRRQAAAGRSRAAARRGRGVLPALHRRAARRDRQPRRRQGRPARSSGALRRRRSVPRRRGRQGHRRVLRRRQRDRVRARASGSATRSPRAARTATTTRRWASPPAARGSRCAATSAT